MSTWKKSNSRVDFYLLYTGVCPDYTFTEISDSCYRAIDQAVDLTFSSAKGYCVNNGGSHSSILVNINSADVQNAVEKVIRSLKPKPEIAFWTGMKVQKRTNSDGRVEWVDDQKRPLSYTHFVENQQHPDGVACVVVSQESSYKWETLQCDSASPFKPSSGIVCQSDQGEMFW